MPHPNTTTFIPTMSQTPQKYIPPPFAQRLHQNAPTHRLNLSMRPTPIEPWDLHSALPNLPPTTKFYIKRDDQTGGPTSGNKIRKLDFLLADALVQKANTIITAGGVQSNHARATAIAARRLGLQAHVFLRTRDTNPEHLGAEGNVLFHKMLGVGIHLVKPMPYKTGLLPRMERLAERIGEEGDRAYIIGIGGSDRIGLWGYIECFAELVEQGVLERFSDIVFAVGSGGTASGLAIGNYLTGGKVKLHAVTVCDTADYFYDHLDEMLMHTGLSGETDARQILNIIEAKGKGYAVSTEEELEFGLNIARHTGIFLDRVYTLKAMYGLVRELTAQPNRHNFGHTLLFIHTGGIFGLFDRQLDPLLPSSLASAWSD